MQYRLSVTRLNENTVPGSVRHNTQTMLPTETALRQMAVR